jgi:anthranilate/para-aminobenzoate synthase component II
MLYTIAHLEKGCDPSLHPSLAHCLWTTCFAEHPLVLKNNAIDLQQLRLLVLEGGYDNVVISPGPGTPDREEDVGEAAALALLHCLCSKISTGLASQI